MKRYICWAIELALLGLVSRDAPWSVTLYLAVLTLIIEGVVYGLGLDK